MTYVYLKRGRWYAGVKSRGVARQVALGRGEGECDKAGALALALEIDAQQEPLTVADYAPRWLDHRRERGVRSYHDDATRIKLHVLPSIGGIPLTELRLRELRAMVDAWRGKLAPRTQWTVYGLVKQLLRSACDDEIIQASPCGTGRSVGLQPKRDADPAWRVRAVYSRRDVELLLGDAIPPRWRAYYALLFLAGLRVGEASALRWDDYDAITQPLGRLTVSRSWDSNHGEMKTTKTGVARIVPVHPVLRGRLKAWGVSSQGGDSLIVPGKDGQCLDRREVYRMSRRHMVWLGIEPRRVHDARRTFVSLCRADGAQPDILQLVSHGPSRSMLDTYTTIPWAKLCEEVAKLKIEVKQ